jgi:transposase
LLAGERRNATPTNDMTNKSTHNSEIRAEQAASKKLETIKLGLDVHAGSIVVVRILDHSAPQPAQKFTPAKFKEWVKTQLGLAAAVHSCYEAGPFGYGLHRYLVELGIQNVVVQPVCLDEHHKGVNHDRSDAKELAMRLDRYVAGNTHALAGVRVPTPQEEQKRVASRQREQIKRAVQRLAAQGRGLLLTQEYRESKGWWQGRRWEKLQTQLPAWLVERLEVFRRLLDTLTVELQKATEALEQVAPGGATQRVGRLDL